MSEENPDVIGSIRPLRRGGPEQCLRHCGDCVGMDHHWLDHACFPEDFNADNPAEPFELEAMAAGLNYFYACKHCAAWIEACPDCREFPCACDLTGPADRG